MVMGGGSWKKLEDDVIRAGVMKYGTKMWTKISTLLRDKTPKQCKERWKRVLSQSTDFKDEEVVELLSLYDAFPNQWNTIAACFSNKSPRQCYEAYQRALLEGIGRAGEAEEPVEQHRVGHVDIPTLCSGAFVREDAEGATDVATGNHALAKYGAGGPDLDIEERDILDVAKARLENTMGRKELKKRRSGRRKEPRKTVGGPRARKSNI